MLLDISNLHDAVAVNTHFPIAIVATTYVAVRRFERVSVTTE
jgi:hypothetical protein